MTYWHMRKPLNKKRKIFSFVSLGFAISFAVILVVFSCFPGDMSGSQSDFVSYIFSDLINAFSPPSYRTMIEPNGLYLESDNSLLPDKEGVSQIAEGTTSMLRYKVDAPKTLGKDEYLNPSFKYEIEEGDPNGILLFINESEREKTVWIETHSLGHYVISFLAGKEAKARYEFDVTPLPKPADETYRDIPKTLPLGTSYRFDFMMEDKEVPSHDNFYYHRYFSPEMTEFSSDNETICRFEKNVLKAVGIGQSKIHIGELVYDIEVTSESDPLPSYEDGFALTKEGENLAINDCDYFSVSQGIYSGVKLSAPYDSYFFLCQEDGTKIDMKDANLSARLWQIDERTAYVLGYREARDIFVKAETRDLKSDLTAYSSEVVHLTYSDIPPVSMSLLVNGSLPASLISGMQGKTYYIQGSFLGANNNSNVTNRKIGVLNPDEELYTINGQNSESLSITFKKEGTVDLEIASLANPSLKETLHFEVALKPAADPTDEELRSFVRKLFGHGTLFALFAISSFLFVYLYFDEKWGLFGIVSSLGASFLLALLTEGIQYFVPGRTANMKDVGIDTLGGTMGIALVYVIVLTTLLIRHWRDKKKRKNE